MTRRLALLAVVLLTLGPSVSRTAAQEGAVFRYDPRTGKCLDAGGREGLNPGATGEELLRQGKAAVECVDFTKARANMTYLRLIGANLRGASFLGADLTYNTFAGALLEGARFNDATRLPFSRADAEARGMTFVPSNR